MNNLSITKLNEIVKTLPISYYLGKNIPIKLSEAEPCSYFDQLNHYIVISYKQLFNINYAIPATDEELEADIRCMLYHEISHVLLTPNFNLFVDTLGSDSSTQILTKNYDVFNIFEDERIETVLKYYYKKVNFKQFVKKVNNYKKITAPATADQFYYHVVRFDEGPADLINEKNRLIKNYSTLSCVANMYTIKNYILDVYKFYGECVAYFMEHEKTISKPKKSTPSIKIKDNNPKTTASEDDTEDDTEDDIEIETEDPNVDSMPDYNSEDIREQIEDIKHKIFSIVDDFEKLSSEYFSTGIKKILFKYSGMHKINSGARAAYSGRLNPRLTVNNNYKWWTQNQSNTLNNGVDSKLHINFYIDNSGSFSAGALTVNKMLSELAKLESTNNSFTFDLITINMNAIEHNKKDRLVIAHGGNRLPANLIDIADKHNYKDRDVINLVMFDGDAISDEYGSAKDKAKNVAKQIWNNNKTIIISEESNYWFTYHCPNAKVIITGDYVNNLINTTLNTLAAVIR